MWNSKRKLALCIPIPKYTLGRYFIWLNSWQKGHWEWFWNMSVFWMKAVKISMSQPSLLPLTPIYVFSPLHIYKLAINNLEVCETVLAYETFAFIPSPNIQFKAPGITFPMSFSESENFQSLYRYQFCVLKQFYCLSSLLWDAIFIFIVLQK